MDIDKGWVDGGFYNGIISHAVTNCLDQRNAERENGRLNLTLPMVARLLLGRPLSSLVEVRLELRYKSGLEMCQPTLGVVLERGGVILPKANSTANLTEVTRISPSAIAAPRASPYVKDRVREQLNE